MLQYLFNLSQYRYSIQYESNTSLTTIDDIVADDN